MLRRRLEVAADQREQPDEVVAVPVAVDVRLAEADPRPRSELPPERVRAPELDEDRRPVSVAEATPATVGVAQDDLPALERRERAEGEPAGDVGRDPHGRTDPCPGTSGGLR